MILKDAKTPLHLLRSSVLSSVRPRPAPSNGEFVHAALRIATPKTISDSEATVLCRHLFADCSLNSCGVAGVGPIWASGKFGKSLDDDLYGKDDSDDSDSDYDNDNFDLRDDDDDDDDD